MCNLRLPARSRGQPASWRFFNIAEIALKYLKPCSWLSLIFSRFALMNAIKTQCTTERKFYFYKTFRDVACRDVPTKYIHRVRKVSAEQDWVSLLNVHNLLTIPSPNTTGLLRSL